MSAFFAGLWQNGGESYAVDEEELGDMSAALTPEGHVLLHSVWDDTGPEAVQGPPVSGGSDQLTTR